MVVKQPTKNQAECRAKRNSEPQVASHGAEYDAQARADSQANSGASTRRHLAIRSLTRHVTSYPDRVSPRAVAARDTAGLRSVTTLEPPSRTRARYPGLWRQRLTSVAVRRWRGASNPETLG